MCRHCGSEEGFWFSRCIEQPCQKMHYYCKVCGRPDCDYECDKCEENKEE